MYRLIKTRYSLLSWVSITLGFASPLALQMAWDPSEDVYLLIPNMIGPWIQNSKHERKIPSGMERWIDPSLGSQAIWRARGLAKPSVMATQVTSELFVLGPIHVLSQHRAALFSLWLSYNIIFPCNSLIVYTKGFVYSYNKFCHANLIFRISSENLARITEMQCFDEK